MPNPRHHSGNCVKCGTWRESLHREHILPKYKGGSEDESNIQFICGNCHEDKSRIDMVGIVRSAETRAKISASHRGKTLSPEHRAALGRAGRGRITSEEVRVKQRAAARARWEEYRALSPAVRLQRQIARNDKKLAKLRAEIAIDKPFNSVVD